MQNSFVSLVVPGASAMRAYVSRPEGTPRGGLIVFQEAFGVNAYIRGVADRFAAQGFLAIAPELFHRTAPEGFEVAYTDFELIKPHFVEITPEGIEADAKAAFDWLVSEKIDAANISSIGFCLGGRSSFIANSALPLKAAVSFYGGGTDMLLDRIPKLHGPMLFLWGGKDTHITPDKRLAVVDAMQAGNKDCVDVVFSEADHGFFCDARPAYHKRSAELAWPLVLEFLK
ncbi:MAG: dienelactone hydrolase family protein [Patescibacteria group bacterium]